MPHGYRYEDILARVQARVRDDHGEIEGRRHKDVYEDPRVRVERSQWNRKWRGTTRFTFEELGALADFFDAPYGWPFLDWQYASSLKNAAGLLVRTERQRSQPEQPPSPPAASPSGRPGKRTPGGRQG